MAAMVRFSESWTAVMSRRSVSLIASMVRFSDATVRSSACRAWASMVSRMSRLSSRTSFRSAFRSPIVAGASSGRGAGSGFGVTGSRSRFGFPRA